MTDPAAPGRRRPKVCHIIHLDGPGGGPILVIDQLRAFSDIYELGVIHGGAGLIADYCDQNDIPHWRLPLDRLSTLAVGLLCAIARLRKWRPDAVVLHGQWAGPIGAIACVFSGIKRILYIAHWPAFYTDWDLFRLVRNRLVEMIACHLATRVVTTSKGNQYQYLLRRLVDSEKLFLIHNSVHPARIPSAQERSRMREKLGWPDCYTHVVSVGRLADQKRVDWLLRSWELVSRRAPHARLWIVGDGPDRQALEELADELCLNDSCVFLGSRPDGISYIAAGDLVAMTTIYEAFGVVAVEAMACGKAIVASKVDGVSDTVRDGLDGFLVPPGETELFAQRILQLIDAPELRKQMGDRGLTRAMDFSPEKIMTQYRAVMDDLLAGQE